MKRSARLFVVLLGLGVAGGAGAASRPQGSVGPDISNAVRTQKAVGPGGFVFRAVHTDKAVGPRVYAAVKTQKAVGPLKNIAVKNHKTVGPRWARAVHSDKAVGKEEKQAGPLPVLDLNAGF